MERHVRGTIAHRTLEAFFRELKEVGRPAEGERWTDADRVRLLQILDEHLDDARGRGLLGMEIFNGKGNCKTCHAGFNFTDEQYHNLGIGMDAPKPDLGR